MAGPVFRTLFLANAASSLGTWMQDVGRAWLMTEMTASPTLIALVQSAVMLSLALLTLPAGVAADALDRRRVLIASQAWSTLAAAAAGLAAWSGAMTPGLLLALTFAAGAGAAFIGPAFQAALPEMVAEEDLPQASVLNGMAFNLARAVGPAAGGLAVAAAGPASVFLLNAATLAAFVVVLARWRPPPRPPASPGAPRERALEALTAGLRYARAAPGLRAALLRTLLFAAPASALWALLPSFARLDPDAGPQAYGLMLAALGAGSVAAGLALPRARARLGASGVLILGASALAGGIAAAALAPAFALPALAVAGMGWLASMATLMVAAQSAAPAWVRGRAMSIFLLAFAAAMAAGSAAWGVAAERIGVAPALLAAAGLQVLGALAGRRLALVQPRDPSARVVDSPWPPPNVVGDVEAEAGPVHVTVEYQVAPGREAEFLAAMAALAPTRKATGTLFWSLFKHGAEPGRYMEANLVGSWGEHLRQRDRQTAASAALEAEVAATLQPGSRPIVTHWLALGHGPAAPHATHPH